MDQTGRYFESASGQKIYPEEPEFMHIDIADIASSLAKQCRYNGHCSRFYSVAEHSFHVATWINAQYCNPELTLQALLHDAAEAYVGDIIRPLKLGFLHSSGIRELEARWDEVIMAAFGLPEAIHPAIKEADLGILKTEREALFPHSENLWDYQLPGVLIPNVDVKILCWDAPQAESVFHRTLVEWTAMYQRRNPCGKT